MSIRVRHLLGAATIALIALSGCGKESPATPATPQAAPTPAPAKGGSTGPGGKQIMILKE
ncbi:hypothetical protein GobsT_64880 [Gemmata obscuriglobus]|nr:hypothetical protein GobsT_64880 [Gemmata obscuriglobus]VTS10989.1 unnamed protein product [Gemmata obscuriglobus UQM 2246]